MSATAASGDARRPARLVVAGFGLAAVVGTVLLMLPWTSISGEGTDPLPALFTAVSALCVTGLAVNDVAQQWNTAGRVVLLALMQVGGIGVITFATLLTVAVFQRFDLSLGSVALAENHSDRLGGLGVLLRGIVLLTVSIEAVVLAVLSLRFHLAYGMDIGHALWEGLVYSVSAFNNVGLGSFSGDVTAYHDDPVVLPVLATALTLGGLGYPVLVELRARAAHAMRARRRHRSAPRRPLSLHARITLATYGVLSVLGAVSVMALEWTNGGTLAALPVWGRVLCGGFMGLSPRTAGFNCVDVGAMHTQSWLVTDLLMFVGGGSAGTAGGLKVGTLAVLAALVITVLRGEEEVHLWRRRIPFSVLREAVTVGALSITVVFAATLALSMLTSYDLDRIVYEVLSAFSTVGLTTGITPSLPAVAQLVLVAVMFVGRLGPVALGSALALRTRDRRYRYPTDRTIVG